MKDSTSVLSTHDLLKILVIRLIYVVRDFFLAFVTVCYGQLPIKTQEKNIFVTSLDEKPVFPAFQPGKKATY